MVFTFEPLRFALSENLLAFPEMDPLLMKEEPHDGSYGSAQWGYEQHHYHNPHVQSPVHEMNGFSFVPPSTNALHIETAYSRPMLPHYAQPNLPSPQPIYQAQWPSMLINPSNHAQMPLPVPPPLAPISTYATAHSMPPMVSAPPPMPSTIARRTLTDQDRRRMCQYHEENPNAKQTEIGAMFGVERSTVSKVFRQKEKYLCLDEGCRSPIKKPKGKFPDIERALAVWVRNHEKQGLSLSDSIIREKARFFATTVGGTDSYTKLNSNTWLEKFKQKNNLLIGSARKSSIASDAGDPGSDIASGTQTPDGISPTSPLDTISPSTISSMPSRDNLRSDDQETYFKFSGNYQAYTQNTASCSPQVSDTAPNSAFPSTSQSPVAHFHSPTNITHTNPYIPLQIAHSCSIGGGSTRVRSQLYPALGIDTTMSSQSGNMTPRQLDDNISAPALETPVDEYGDRSASSLTTPDSAHLLVRSVSGTIIPNQGGSPSMMAPPLRPASVSPLAGCYSPFTAPPSQDDARKAMELVMSFFQSQPNGVVDPQEYITMGKLMEKLKVQGPLNELPGGMHSIDIHKEISKKRSIHSL